MKEAGLIEARADPPHRRGGLPLRRRQALGIRHDHHAAAFKMNPAAERAPAEELAPRRFAQVDFDPGFVVVEVKGVTPAALDPPRHLDARGASATGAMPCCAAIWAMSRSISVGSGDVATYQAYPFPTRFRVRAGMPA